MNKHHYALVLGTIGLLIASVVPMVAAAPAVRAEEALLADGTAWDTILTSATFKPPKNLNSVDKLYVFSLDGQRPVAEAAPYEKDYNGGRWWVHLVEFTELGLSIHDSDHDGVADFELTSDDAVLQHEALGHLTITPTQTFFECPLLRA
ncbi:MAG: hypothetical protein ACFFC0_05425 [Promethearchaeota archaeon]